jgi:catechol 2,3-dioxygenase-like lactoylglutathione lyase family enzyme
MLDADKPDWLFREQSHIGVVCHDIERTIAEYELLGYTFVLRSGSLALRRPGFAEHEAFNARSAWSLQGPPHIELAEVVDAGRTPYLWPSRGHDHVEHVGYWVDDLVAASAALEALGFPLEATPAGDDTRPLGFCYHRSPSGGVRIELEDGPMRKQILAKQFARVRAGETGVIAYQPFVSDAGPDGASSGTPEARNAPPSAAS